MDELQNFVEIELAQMESGRAKKKLSRDPEAGLKHLDWAASLSNPRDDGTDEPDESKRTPSRQALDAMDIREIYVWWTKTRPARVNPNIETGLHQFCREMDDKYCTKDSPRRLRSRWVYHYGNRQIMTDDEQAKYNELVKRAFSMEQEREAEDEAMLIKLIKVRKGLWT
jgi:hypothetical protein